MTHTIASLEALSRKEIQDIAKSLGIRANQKTADMIAAILAMASEAPTSADVDECAPMEVSEPEPAMAAAAAEPVSAGDAPMTLDELDGPTETEAAPVAMPVVAEPRAKAGQTPSRLPRKSLGRSMAELESEMVSMASENKAELTKLKESLRASVSVAAPALAASAAAAPQSSKLGKPRAAVESKADSKGGSKFDRIHERMFGSMKSIKEIHESKIEAAGPKLAGPKPAAAKPAVVKSAVAKPVALVTKPVGQFKAKPAAAQLPMKKPNLNPARQPISFRSEKLLQSALQARPPAAPAAAAPAAGDENTSPDVAGGVTAMGTLRQSIKSHAGEAAVAKALANEAQSKARQLKRSGKMAASRSAALDAIAV